MEPCDYEFQVDRDLTKHVSVARLGETVTIRVRYASDIVLRDDTHRLRIRGPIDVISNEHGLVVSYERRTCLAP